MLHAAGRDSARPARAGWRPSSASATSCTVRPAASRRAGSATTSISRVSLALTSTCPTPGTRASARAHDVKGVVVADRRTAAAGEVQDVASETPRASAARRSDRCPPAASARSSSILLCTCCSATTMSVRGFELRRNLGGAAERRRPDAADAGHLHDRLLERPGDRQHHGAGRQRAAVADDHDARELERRVDAAREVPIRRPARRPPAAQPQERSRGRSDRRVAARLMIRR